MMGSDSSIPIPSRWKSSIPEWVQIVASIAFLMFAIVMDSNRLFGKSWSALYILSAINIAWTLRGRAEFLLLTTILLAVYLVPVVCRPETVWHGWALYHRTTGVIGTLAIVALIWDRRRYISDLQFAHHELARKYAATSNQLQETTQSLGLEVAQRKKSEESLFISDQRFARFMEHLPVLAWIKDSEGRYIYANDPALRVFQKTPEDVQGRKDEDLFTSNLSLTYIDSDPQIPVTPEYSQSELSLTEGSGLRHHSIVTTFPIHGVDGSSPLTGGVAIDITERQRAENALHDSEKRFRQLFENAPYCIHELDLHGRFLSINPAGLSMMLIENQPAVLGSSFFDVVSRPDRSRIVELFEAAKDGRSPNFEFRTVDGRSLISNFVSVSDDRIMGITKDVTERKRAEEELRMTRFCVDHAADMVIWVNHVGGIEFANRAACTQLGYSLEEIPNLTIFNFLDESDYRLDDWNRDYGKLTTSGQITFESRLRAKDGYKFPVEISANHVVMNHQEFTFAFIRNISARKAIENELLTSRQRLEVLSRQLIAAQESERRRLARELHDEIGQVLTAIKMSLRRTQQNVPTTAQQLLDENVKIVEGAIAQIRNLSLSLRPAQLDELGLVAALHWLVKHQGHYGNVETQLNVEIGETPIPSELETVCFRIAQEALTNAVRHGRPNLISVKLSTSPGQIHLTIHDDGIGFDVSASRNRARDGASIGLISMQERASLVGGRADIESSPGCGTRIFVQLPSVSYALSTHSQIADHLARTR